MPFNRRYPLHEWRCFAIKQLSWHEYGLVIVGCAIFEDSAVVKCVLVSNLVEVVFGMCLAGQRSVVELPNINNIIDVYIDRSSHIIVWQYFNSHGDGDSSEYQ